MDGSKALLRYFLTLSFTVIVTSQLHEKTEIIPSDYCPGIHDYRVEYGGQHCCNDTYSEFKEVYIHGTVRLSSLLEKLRDWKCPMFRKECSKREFDVNDFTSKLYDRFCDEDRFKKECYKSLSHIGLLNYKTTSASDLNISIAEFHHELLHSSCIQAAVYRYGEAYVEVSNPVSSFCNPVWCGFDDKTSKSYGDSRWPCIPTRCRTNLLIIMAASCLLAIVVIAVNSVVISLIVKSRNFPSSQMIYMLSLAVSDLLVGLFVLPSFVSSLYISQIGSYKRIYVKTPVFSSKTSYSVNVTDLNTTFKEYDPNTNFYLEYIMPKSYIDFIGFMTCLSLIASVNTLALASMDRFRAVKCYLAYNPAVATATAKRLIIILWTVGFVVALLPVFVPGIEPYKIIAGGVLVTVTSLVGVVIHGVSFIVPFVAVWCFTIGTLVIIKRRHKAHSSPDRFHTKNLETEKQLTKTLAMMVTVFTFSVLPSIIFIILPKFLPSIENAAHNEKQSRNTKAIFVTAETIAVFMLLSYSILNCSIYGTRNKEFKRATAKQCRAIARTIRLLSASRVKRGTFNQTAVKQTCPERMHSEGNTSCDKKTSSGKNSTLATGTLQETTQITES